MVVVVVTINLALRSLINIALRESSCTVHGLLLLCCSRRLLVVADRVPERISADLGLTAGFRPRHVLLLTLIIQFRTFDSLRMRLHCSHKLRIQRPLRRHHIRLLRRQLLSQGLISQPQVLFVVVQLHLYLWVLSAFLFLVIFQHLLRKRSQCTIYQYFHFIWCFLTGVLRDQRGGVSVDERVAFLCEEDGRANEFNPGVLEVFGGIYGDGRNQACVLKFLHVLVLVDAELVHVLECVL